MEHQGCWRKLWSVRRTICPQKFARLVEWRLEVHAFHFIECSECTIMAGDWH